MSLILSSFNKLLNQRVAPLSLFCIGAILRLKHFFENRSLWMDEAYLSLDIANCSFSELARFITYYPQQPRQPVGFLLITKLNTLLLGISEYSFRLFPLICSLLTLYLVYVLAKKISGRKEALLTLAFFALAEPLIYYAAEVKPYSSDVLISLILLTFVVHYFTETISKNSIRLFTLVGFFAIWLSTPSLFMLLAIGLFTLSKIIKDKKRELYIPFTSALLFFIFNFIVIYEFSLSKMLSQKHFITSSKAFFPPELILSLTSIVWTLKRFIYIFEHCLGMGFGYLAFSFFCIGIYSFYKNNRKLLTLLLLPSILFLAANALHKYPFHFRMILFLTPGIIIITVRGIFTSFKLLSIRNFYIQAIILIILIAPSIKTSIHPFISSHKREETRPLMKHLSEHYKKGDAIIYNNSAQYAFGFYHGYFNMGSYIDLALKIHDWENDVDTLIIDKDYIYNAFNSSGYHIGHLKTPYESKLLPADKPRFDKNPNTWVLFTHLPPQQERMIIAHFSQQGKLKNELKETGASLYLFDMSQ